MNPRETKKDNWIVVKWDVIANLLFLGAFLYFRDLKVLGILVFSQIFVLSYFMFSYKGPWVTIMFASITALFFYFVANIPPRFMEMEFFFRVVSWAFLCYTLFWVIISVKNYVLYLRSLRPKICPLCGKEDKELVIYLEEAMCHQCFDLGTFIIQDYHGINLNFWDFEVMDSLEIGLGESIPLIDMNQLHSSTDSIFDIPFGFTVRDQKVSNLMLSGKTIRDLNLAIGTLSFLEFLNLYNNNILLVPVSFQRLKHMKRFDVRQNPLQLNTLEMARTFEVLRENGCNVLMD